MIATCPQCRLQFVVGLTDAPREPGGWCRKCLALADARCDAVDAAMRVGGCTGAAALSLEPGLQVMCCDGGDGQSAERVARLLADLGLDVDVEVRLTARRRVVSVAAVRVGDQIVALAWVASPLLDSEATDHARTIAISLAQNAQRIGGST